MALDLKDLKSNTLNDFTISEETPAGARRRTSPLAAMRKGLEMVYARHAQTPQGNALVIHAQEIQGPATYSIALDFFRHKVWLEEQRVIQALSNRQRGSIRYVRSRVMLVCLCRKVELTMY